MSSHKKIQLTCTWPSEWFYWFGWSWSSAGDRGRRI